MHPFFSLNQKWEDFIIIPNYAVDISKNRLCLCLKGCLVKNLSHLIDGVNF